MKTEGENVCLNLISKMICSKLNTTKLFSFENDVISNSYHPKQDKQTLDPIGTDSIK